MQFDDLIPGVADCCSAYWLVSISQFLLFMTNSGMLFVLLLLSWVFFTPPPYYLLPMRSILFPVLIQPEHTQQLDLFNLEIPFLSIQRRIKVCMREIFQTAGVRIPFFCPLTSVE